MIAETGAGQHGVATATAAALLGLECVIYMGEVDCERQALNVARMKLLGAKVVPVTTAAGPSRTPSTRRSATGSPTSTTPTTCSAPSPGRTRSRRSSATSPASSASRPAGRCWSSPAGCPTRSPPRRRRLQRDRHLPRLHRRRGRPAARLRGRPATALETGEHALTLTAGLRRRPARLAHLRAAGRRGPDHRVALDLRRPRLPGRRPRARLAQGHRPRHLPRRSPTPRRWRPSRCCPGPRASSRRSSPRTRSRARSSSAASSGPEATILVNLSGRGDKDMGTAMKYFNL